ncbi:MAG: hypothetical protein NXH85_04290 [Pseudomonadaceae bacterium]|nr:hypothetical protein [Pseudomonadaceae bacterium]
MIPNNEFGTASGFVGLRFTLLYGPGWGKTRARIAFIVTQEDILDE